MSNKKILVTILFLFVTLCSFSADIASAAEVCSVQVTQNGSYADITITATPTVGVWDGTAHEFRVTCSNNGGDTTQYHTINPYTFSNVCYFESGYVYGGYTRNLGNQDEASCSGSILSPVTGFWSGASSCGNNWINLSWNAVGGATSYQVYRNGSLIYNGASLAISDTGLTMNGSYSYTITASNAGGTSSSVSSGPTTVANYCSCTGTPWGTIPHGDSGTTYQSLTVPYGSSCVSEVRTCSNGSFSGSYPYTTCSAEAASSCSVSPWGTIGHGEYVTAYAASTADTCSSQTRTCSNGTLSNTYAYGGCSVNSYSITFDSAGGSAVSTITQEYGTSVSAPANPTRSNYTFAGWSPSLSSTMPSGGQSLTATWSQSATPAPTISGSTTGYTDTSYTYTVTATDPQGDQIRYGVDWNMDGTADDWLPGGVSYVNSGTSRNVNYSWSTTGSKTFRALTQDAPGLNSAWTNYTVTIGSAPVDGVCGTRNTTYPQGTTEYPGGSTYCSAGTESASPAFPSPGASVTWTCNGLYSGGNSPTCTSTLILTTYTIHTVATAGGSIESTSDNVIDCNGSCSYDYNDGSSITLQAIPASSYWAFFRWSGACSGTSPTCVLTADSDKNVTAVFRLRRFDYQEF